MANVIELVTPNAKVSIVYASADPKLDSTAAHLLAQDIHRVTGYLPHVSNDFKLAKGNVIIIGTIQSALIKKLNLNTQSLQGKWECYSLQVISNPTKNIKQALVIAGSDVRGAAYGVFDVSQKIGVSPWYWWADVEPVKRNSLSLNIDNYTSQPPSVKYRGILINDEDWGLQPWAAKTHEPETGDIGPKTYGRVFELLLRLKANLIWPAMHPSTKAFYTIPGNAKVAADYEIVVGSSHAEPMLRNNVGEWHEKTIGHFNYLTNKPTVYKYWEDRVKQSSANNVMYSIGMRGVHDGAMEGVKGPKQAVPLLQDIFADQRALLAKYVNKDVTKVPQVFTIYKEVLENYEAGLNVPDDVTLIWPDDNYGYIQRLSNTQEQKRKGGSGVYYHASYWGRPHDYLWLGSTHPGLMQEEMTKAYQMEARQVWVLNIGDIKPCEYNMQLFLDMAYNIKPFLNCNYAKNHHERWAGNIFGHKQAADISNVMWQYYKLAFERRPEFMGWSQTEPTTAIRQTDYNHLSYGDQAQRRIDEYQKLQQEVNRLSSLIKPKRKDAWYELVEYPVTGASLINQKFLYNDKAVLYQLQGRKSAAIYRQMATKSYEQIQDITRKYNDSIANGKWRFMMSMNPRKLPVFDKLKFNRNDNLTEGWAAIAEGAAEAKEVAELPVFDCWARQQYFIDVYLGNATKADLVLKCFEQWIKVSQSKIQLNANGLNSQARVWVSINWNKAPKNNAKGEVEISDGKRNFTVKVSCNNFKDMFGIAEHNKATGGKYLAFAATAYTNIKNNKNLGWRVLNNLGSADSCLQAWPLNVNTVSAMVDTTTVKNGSWVSYDFYIANSANATISVFTIPTHPLNNSYSMQYGVSVDGGVMQIMNFKTISRSEEWKQNVLRNAAIRTTTAAPLKAGKHTFTIYQIDPGIILDHIFIDMGAPEFYGNVK